MMNIAVLISGSGTNLQTLIDACERKEIEASTKLMEAEAEAKAKVIRAGAEKKSNELLEKSLTPALLEQQWIEKWDGILPQVSGDGVSPIVNMRQNKQ